MRAHSTHHDDCGCLSARKDAEIADLRDALAKVRSVLSRQKDQDAQHLAFLDHAEAAERARDEAVAGWAGTREDFRLFARAAALVRRERDEAVAEVEGLRRAVAHAHLRTHKHHPSGCSGCESVERALGRTDGEG